MRKTINSKQFETLLKEYKTTRMSGYTFTEALILMGVSEEYADMIHRAATVNY